MRKSISYAPLYCLVFKAVIVLCLVEISLRLIPACDAPYAIFDKADKILKYDNTIQRDGIYTEGNLAQIKAKWHINNMGWLSDRDYFVDNNKPVIAVIGDSYVEALHVNSDKNLVANLQNKLPDYSCYSFGSSGGELGHYLQMSRYVHSYFHPKVMVFNLTDSDVLGSLQSNADGGLYFTIGSNGITELPIKPYVPSSINRFLRKSAIARYFKLNKQISGNNTAPSNPQKNSESITSDIMTINKYQIITDYAFSKIRTENPATSIVIVINGPISDIYRGKKQDKNIEFSKIIANNAHKYGFYVIDMAPPMIALYTQNNLKFDFDNNLHWNEYGHRVVADQIYKYMIQSEIVFPANISKPLPQQSTVSVH
jgi:hypothetical protein